MAFESRDLMVNVLPSAGGGLQACPWPTNTDGVAATNCAAPSCTESEPCPTPSCGDSATKEVPCAQPSCKGASVEGRRRRSAGADLLPGGLALLQQQLRQALAQAGQPG